MPAPSAAHGSLAAEHLRERVEFSGRQLGVVSDAIRHSWERSAAAGLLPDQVHAPYEPDVDADGRLRWAAAPAMTAVSLDLGDMPAALLLSEPRGQILARWSASRTAVDLMDGIGGAPGYICSEAAVGTNSIGLALATRRPTVVRGFEHFADRLTGFAGISRIVLDPTNSRAVGAVTLVCPDREYSPVMRALVGRIAYETRQRLAPDPRPGDARIRSRFLDARRTATGPVAAFDTRTLLTNAAGRSLLGANPDLAELWRWSLRTISDGGPARPAVMGGRVIPDGRCEPIYDGAALVGVLATWDPTAPSGAQPLDRSGWAALTASERSVAGHIARGLSNRETATLLFVSPHTVDYHLRQVFRKLDVHSRVELARKAAVLDA